MRKPFTSNEIQAIQSSVPGTEVISTRLAVISTNGYDPYTTFHTFIETEEEGNNFILEMKKEGWKVNFRVERLYMICRI